MSLKVWLPLTGDLRNLGTSNLAVTVNSATVDNNGKIGKCYAFNGSTSYIALSGNDLFKIFTGGTQQFSITMWVFHSDTTRAILFGDYSTSGGIGFNIELSTSHAVRFYWNGSPDTYPANASVTANGWTHVALTYNGTKLQSYINGIEKGSWSGTLATKNKTSGEFRLGRDNRSDSTAFNGRMNDFRVYDHCLSLSEIKEISQGLVLHYKFDDKPINISPNLVTSITKGGQTTIDTTKIFGVQTSGSNADTYFTLNLSESITVGQRYLLSCYASGIPENDYWTFPLGTQSNSALPFNIHNGFNNIEFVANDINWGSNRLFLDDTKRISSICKFYNFILTKLKNEVKDSSGYGHNGEIISELRISNNSARYKNSTLFDGVDNCIITPYNTICPENIFTINLWFKKDALGSKNYETLFGGPSGFEMDTRAGSATSLSLYMASTRSGNRATGITMNEWHMITMTRDGTTEKYYVDGEFKSEIEAKPMPNGVYRIGAWASNTGQNYYGLINDFRIYATPLLDNDIKKLYNTSMSVDKAHRTHTFELEEETTNLLFPAENNRIQLEFGHGLSRYTQANCQVTLTQDGYHIYRPPNYTPANNGNTMWGGLKLVNQSTDTISPYNSTRDNIWGLTTGHTYLITFMVTGQSSNGASISMNHNMGNGVSNGIGPSPTVLKEKTLPANFEGTQQCYRIFTINDDIVKTCNKTGAGYTIDQQYLSYRHIVFGFGYSNTGTLGTDLYLTHFQLYDITDKIGQVLKNGVVDFSSFNEEDIENAKIQRSSIFFADGFIER